MQRFFPILVSDRYKFECGGIVPVRPIQLYNLAILALYRSGFPSGGRSLRWGGKSPLRECILRRLLEKPERGESSGRKVQLWSRSGCAKSLWARRNIAAELSSALAGEASVSCPNHKGCAGCLACSSGLPRVGGQVKVGGCGFSAGQKCSAASLSTLCRGPQVPFGNCCARELLFCVSRCWSEPRLSFEESENEGCVGSKPRYTLPAEQVGWCMA